MSQEIEQEPASTPENVAQESEIQQQPGATDTPETVAETDEQKNQRELAERQKRSERASRGIQKRFDELTAEKHAYRQQAEQALALVAQALGRGAQAQPGQQDATTELQRGPDEAYEDWIKRSARWEAKQEAANLVRQQFAAVQQQSGQAAVQQAAVQMRTQFEGRMAEFAKASPDWDEVVAKNEDIEIPDESVGLIHMRPDGPAILYAIGKNPALAAQLHGKNPLEQAMVIGQISAQLKAPPQVSKAPPPGQPVGSRGGAASSEPSDEDSPDVWLKKRRAQLAKG